MLTLMILLLAEAPTGLETSTAAAANAMALRPALPANFPGTWATSNDYPPQALRNMEQGATGYELSVAPDGKVESCLITASSGSMALDEATCRLVADRARFTPATDATGRAVAGGYASRVNWVLPSARGALKPGKLAFRWTPSKTFLLRGSIGSGFKSPTVPQLKAAQQLYGVTNSPYDCTPELLAMAQTLGIDPGTELVDARLDPHGRHSLLSALARLPPCSEHRNHVVPRAAAHPGRLGGAPQRHRRATASLRAHRGQRLGGPLLGPEAPPAR